MLLGEYQKMLRIAQKTDISKSLTLGTYLTSAKAEKKGEDQAKHERIQITILQMKTMC